VQSGAGGSVVFGAGAAAFVVGGAVVGGAVVGGSVVVGASVVVVLATVVDVEVDVVRSGFEVVDVVSLEPRAETELAFVPPLVAEPIAPIIRRPATTPVMICVFTGQRRNAAQILFTPPDIVWAPHRLSKVPI
jgi:hypothetical protein